MAGTQQPGLFAIMGVFAMGSLCFRTPNWPGQDFFKTVLKFGVLPTQASFLPSLLSQVSTLPPGLKPHPIYSSSLPLYISKVFPPINFLHIEFCPTVCFLEEGTHKKERGHFFFFFFPASGFRNAKGDHMNACGLQQH